MATVTRTTKVATGTVAFGATGNDVVIELEEDIARIVLQVNGNLDGDNIAAGGVDTAELAALAVEEAKIANAAVTLNKLASNSVNSSKIVANTIVGADVDTTTHLAVAGVQVNYGKWQYDEADNTGGAAITSAGGWTKVPLDTEVADRLGAGFAASVITLPAGTYYVRADTSVMGTATTIAQLRLRDTTGAATSVLGMKAGSGQSSSITNITLSCAGEFTVGVSSAMEFQIRVSANSWMGSITAASFGEEEVFAVIEIWELTA
jgi:hypothetical protein